MSNVLHFPSQNIHQPKISFGFENPIIEKLAIRFNDNATFIDRLNQCWDSKQNEPYKFGCVHEKIWSEDRYQLNMHGYWNKPFPVPSNISYKSIQGVLGKNLFQGGSDPLPFMDRKFKISLNLIRQAKNLPLAINTSSDLIICHEYLDALDKNNHTINICYISDNDEINSLLESGCASFKRRYKAYTQLKELGYKVNLVFLDLRYKGKSLGLDCSLNEAIKKNYNIANASILREIEIKLGKSFKIA